MRALAQDMLDVMYEAEGCGLAGPQVGEMRQIVVIDVDYSGHSKRNPYVLINPKVIKADGDPHDFQEGCLSFPGISVNVTRRPRHRPGQNLDGDLMQYEAEGNLMAVCLQHEIDHLHGVTMVDHLTPSERTRALRDSRTPWPPAPARARPRWRTSRLTRGQSLCQLLRTNRATPGEGRGACASFSWARRTLPWRPFLPWPPSMRWRSSSRARMPSVAAEASFCPRR